MALHQRKCRAENTHNKTAIFGANEQTYGVNGNVAERRGSGANKRKGGGFWEDRGGVICGDAWRKRRCRAVFGVLEERLAARMGDAAARRRRRKSGTKKWGRKNGRFLTFKNEIFGAKMRAKNTSLAIFGDFGNENGSTPGKIVRKRRRYIWQNRVWFWRGFQKRDGRRDFLRAKSAQKRRK